MSKQYSYSELQRIFAIAWTANQDSKVYADEESLETAYKEKFTKLFADETIKGMIGNWNLIWGPKVFEENTEDDNIPTYADNTMFMVQEEGTENYVISIAGTDPYSFYGWIVEDFHVNQAVPWPYKSDAAAKNQLISKGTSIGVEVLTNKMIDKKGGKIIDFVKNIVAQNNHSTITVTGHSLGGALSPSLALAIYDSLGNDLSKATVKTVSFAGPTPGNKEFADHYNASIGANTRRVWNTLDLIPHSWQKDQMQEIPNLYQGYQKPGLLLRMLVVGAIKFSSKYVYTQLATSEPITGKFNPNLGKADASTPAEKQAAKELAQTLIQNNVVDKKTAREIARLRKRKGSKFKNFIKQVGYQHVGAYSDLLKTTDFNNRMVEVIGKRHVMPVKVTIKELLDLVRQLLKHQ